MDFSPLFAGSILNFNVRIIVYLSHTLVAMKCLHTRRENASYYCGDNRATRKWRYLGRDNAQDKDDLYCTLGSVLYPSNHRYIPFKVCKDHDLGIVG